MSDLPLGDREAGKASLLSSEEITEMRIAYLESEIQRFKQLNNHAGFEGVTTPV